MWLPSSILDFCCPETLTQHACARHTRSPVVCLLFDRKSRSSLPRNPASNRRSHTFQSCPLSRLLPNHTTAVPTSRKNTSKRHQQLQPFPIFPSPICPLPTPT